MLALALLLTFSVAGGIWIGLIYHVKQRQPSRVDSQLLWPPKPDSPCSNLSSSTHLLWELNALCLSFVIHETETMERIHLRGMLWELNELIFIESLEHYLACGWYNLFVDIFAVIREVRFNSLG